MKITQRQSIMGVLILLTVINALLVVALLIPNVSQDLNPSLIIPGASSLVIVGLLLYVYWRGWDAARYVVVAYMTLVIAFATPEPFVTQVASLTLFAPPALGLILVEPIWVLTCAGTAYVLLLARAGGVGVYANPITMLLTCIVVGSIIVARLVTDSALASARMHAQQVEEEKRLTEVQALELAEANELMNRQLDQQKQLLDLVATLETPVVQLDDGVLFAPIVGYIDTRRSQNLTTRLLQQVSTERARLIILDISGVSVMDTAVAKALLSTAQALRLLGCDVTLSGITASVAITLIQLGINLEGVITTRSPQEALAQHLKSMLATKTPLNGNGVHKN